MSVESWGSLRVRRMLCSLFCFAGAPRRSAGQEGFSSRNRTMVRPVQKEKPLTKRELDKFKKRLLELREEVAGRIRDRASTARIDGADLIEEMDQANRATEEAFNMRLLDKEVKLLREIDTALAKFDNGTYGICEGTDEP